MRQSPDLCASGNAVAEAPKLLDIGTSESIEVCGRNDDGHLVVLPPYRHQLSLNGIRQSGEPLFGLRVGDIPHSFPVLIQLSKTFTLDHFEVETGRPFHDKPSAFQGADDVLYDCAHRVRPER